jgi:hypothetical protein
MNDLPQNELLSAYLDGELTAAEQAEMERMLAASPAARQLLDELRALSNTLQALPQEKLGEDLSPHVLRVAERRMLTEGEPGDEEGAPVPLARSIFRRVVNRRTMVWLSLTAAIALIIVINERQHAPDQIAQHVADSRVAATKRVLPASEPTAIRAAPDAEDRPRKEVGEVLEKKPATPLAEPAAPAFSAAAPAATLPAPAEKPAEAPRSVAKKGPMPGQGGTVAGKGGAALGVGRQDSDAKFGVGAERGEPYSRKAGKAEQTQKLYEAGEDVQVVRCSISPAAAQRRPLEKLLEANGMVWQKQVAEDQLAEEEKSEASEVAKRPVAAKSRPRSAPQGEVTVVAAEATAAQIEATLASLKAQPSVFLSFSVNPPLADLPPSVARQITTTNRPQRNAALGYRQRDNRADQPRDAIMLNNQLRQAYGQPQRQLLSGSEARQRVLFVLQVAGGDRSAAAAKSRPGVEADAAEPAASPAQPAAPPAPHK